MEAYLARQLDLQALTIMRPAREETVRRKITMTAAREVCADAAIAYIYIELKSILLK